MGILESDEVHRLEQVIEEAARATEEGAKRFIEPASGTLRRATNRRHHIIFGRRGSGKSSLLRKVASDLTVDRRPMAYIDLESFKGHSYPDVLLSVLIKTFRAFAEWLETAAVNPSNKTSFWEKLFGSKPSRRAFNRKDAKALALQLRQDSDRLEEQLHAPDNVPVRRELVSSSEASTTASTTASVTVSASNLSGSLSGTSKDVRAAKTVEEFTQRKTEYLHRHILDYQARFAAMKTLSEGDAFLLLDDLYHIRRSNQASVLDYFHRLAKNNHLWLKVGTIRHRTQWYVHGDPPVGLKVGDDTDEIDLDLTLEKYSTTKKFLISVLGGFFEECELARGDVLTDGGVDRLVLASGGVARDFLGIFRKALAVARERGSGHHRGERVGAEDVNNAAGEYDAAKQEELRRDTLEDQESLEEEFRQVRVFCTSEAKANVLLVNKKLVDESRVEELVDLRLLHKVNSRVTVSGKKGEIYDAYMLDISQYTADRKIRDFELIEFWLPNSRDHLRRTGLIYRDR